MVNIPIAFYHLSGHKLAPRSLLSRQETPEMATVVPGAPLLKTPRCHLGKSWDCQPAVIAFNDLASAPFIPLEKAGRRYSQWTRIRLERGCRQRYERGSGVRSGIRGALLATNAPSSQGKENVST